ncbi:histidinol dehydrogenase [Pectinatus cerevisiiphilus]|uniref:Histidinol dehydrogenase n=1 Tax=Pectinatus cerevisiiphilus TaxID=86956 RepID=A0A4V2USC7_9FIRM|nr:histidinol dehydrogenase [Pectinatus cerevisiiphilus]TCS80922.1 histidinol dehydrogenase/sulfopropanediol 3-dehydrogenase [Pectinatus cerevisiiphilus]
METIKKAAHKTYERTPELIQSVENIINQVKKDGDKAIKELSSKFDGINLQNIKITQQDIKDAYKQVSPETVKYLKFAASQIEFYARKQLACLKELETPSQIEGVTLGHKLIPVNACGAYVPGGRYPLPSTALMLSIPAKIAGVKRVAAVSPAAKKYGTIHPAVLVALDIAGADEIYCVGGAQAIGALAYGTSTIPAVDMIVGPGNRFVTEAKRQVIGKVGIDSLAGPSEVLIIADGTTDPSYTAMDILAQSEHDPSAKAILITTDKSFAEKVEEKIKLYEKELPTVEIAHKAWHDNGVIMLAANEQEMIDEANNIAPEHLEVHTADSLKTSEQLKNYGSLFIGEYTPVAFGDYCSGTNHTLPTMHTAKYSNGVYVGTFIKTSFYQHITKTGCRNLSEACMHLAGVEGLIAHQKSVAIRLK